MIFLSLVQLLFLFRSISGEAAPEPHYFSPPQQRPEPEFWSQINNVEPKTIMISGSNEQRSDPILMQSVLNAVTGGMQSDANSNNSDIPEVVFQDRSYPDQIGQQDQGNQQSMDTIQKVYNLQPFTRLIATSEMDSDKKNQIWRSPLPFMHSEDCPHHKSKKSKSSKKKGRKQRKSETKTRTTPKPNNEMNNESPLGSILSSVLSHTFSAPVFEPEQPKNEIKSPSSFLMSITHKTEPQMVDAPPPLPMFMALIRKQMEQTEPEPELMPPLNPFLALLSKLGSSEPKPIIDIKDKESADQDKDKEQLNFNFNINFTINNHNYPQLDSKLFRPELPLPFFLK